MASESPIPTRGLFLVLHNFFWEVGRDAEIFPFSRKVNLRNVVALGGAKGITAENNAQGWILHGYEI